MGRPPTGPVPPSVLAQGNAPAGTGAPPLSLGTVGSGATDKHDKVMKVEIKIERVCRNYESVPFFASQFNDLC